ncbi:MAG: DUF3173 family protein [Bacteroidales bacterium]|nr:DUF3173 family protein [Bacteroidales bacterium]
MYKQIINKDDLVKLGYSDYMAKEIIRLSRLYMLQCGHRYYESRKVSTVPVIAISEILGFELKIKED